MHGGTELDLPAATIVGDLHFTMTAPRVGGGRGAF